MRQVDGWVGLPSLLSHPVHHTLSQSKTHGIQKKAYRVLEEVCASPQGPGARFVQSHLDDLKKTLLDSLPTERPLHLRLERTPPRQPHFTEETPRPASLDQDSNSGSLTSWVQ